MHTPYRETVGQNTDRAGIVGDSFVDLSVKASRTRYGAERAGPPTRHGGGTPRRGNRVERRSEAGEFRRPKTDQIRLYKELT